MVMDADHRRSYDAVRTIDHQPFGSACYAPFVSLYLDVHGRILACGSNRTTVLGWVGEVTLSDAWNSRAVRDLRESLVVYDLDHGCQRCEMEITGGNPTGALAEGFDHFEAQPIGEEHWPTRMEFALSNTCNLQCVMCSGDFSSAIRAHRERLPPLPSRYGPQFLDELRPFLSRLRQARFLGGEPFLTSEYFQIWDLMIEEGVSIDCNVTTNGTQFGSRVQEVLDHLPFSIGVSMDGVRAETVESIRAGASFERIMKNLQRFREYTLERGTSLSLTYCLMLPNWSEFADYLLLAEDLGCGVYVNTVMQPPRYSLYRLPVGELAAIVDAMERRTPAILPRLILNGSVWEGQLRRLRERVRTLTGSGDTEAGRAGRDWSDLVDRLTEGEMSQARLEHHLGPVAVGGDVSSVACDEQGVIVGGTGYLGLIGDQIVGARYLEQVDLLYAGFGNRLDILAERTANGAVARVLRFRDVDGRTTVAATVAWGQRLDAHGPRLTMHGGALIERPEGPVPQPVQLTRRSGPCEP